VLFVFGAATLIPSPLLFLLPYLPFPLPSITSLLSPAFFPFFLSFLGSGAEPQVWGHGCYLRKFLKWNAQFGAFVVLFGNKLQTLQCTSQQFSHS